MLILHRRHRASCPHRSVRNRRCQCPIYATGTLGGVYVRKSLDMTDWDAATKKIGEWAKDGKVGDLHDTVTTVDAAVRAFFEDAQVRGLSSATVGKYKVLLDGRLLPWARAEGYPSLPTLTLDVLTQFRTTWPDAPLAMSKNTERLKAFLRWCVARGWVATDPSAGLTRIKVPHNPTLPYSEDELSRILDACDRYPSFNQYGYDNKARVRAFVLVLRWTGLRIRDVVTLTWDQVQDGKVRLYTQKTGQHVHVPIPPACVTALERIRTDRPYIFWTGNGHPKSAVADWQRSLRKLFALADLTGAHAHRFRDTFAVELLLSGVEIQDVSILLGHSSVKVTEKHYSPWVRARQERLEKMVERMWHPAATSPPGAPAPPARPASTAPETERNVLARAWIVMTPGGAPVPPPTAGSASPDPASRPQVRTGTDDGCTSSTRATLRLVPKPQSEVR